jgi:hypothetical protein
MRHAREFLRTAGVVASLAAAVATGPASAADDLTVEIVNGSVPTLCAEKDNITLDFRAPEARRFTIEAVHPAYIGTIVVDRWAADFRHCEAGTDPAHKFEPKRVTLFETEEMQLVGLTFPSFWRPNQVPVRVGDRVEPVVHLLQLWVRYQERAEEVLVLYPADGYWRARPLPPAHLRWTAYGSSFLVGPVEEEGRPLVDLSEVAFDPATKTFQLTFARGGTGTLRVTTLDQERIALDVEFSTPVAAPRPFAALRSMYVTETNADVAQLAWRAKDNQAWKQAPLISVKRATAVEVWAGRRIISRHNTSAPDMIFRDFAPK